MAVNTPTPESEYSSRGRPLTHPDGAWKAGEIAAATEGVVDDDGPKPGGKLDESGDDELAQADTAQVTAT